jgi:hypothetical protein
MDDFEGNRVGWMRIYMLFGVQCLYFHQAEGAAKCSDFRNW